MIKAIITMVAKIVTYFFSEEHAAKKAQEERDKIAAEVASGDDDKVNARLNKFRAIPWILLSAVFIGGCFGSTKTVYVREQDKVRALAPGAVYTNETDAVEWIVPRTKMTQLIISAEGL